MFCVIYPPTPYRSIGYLPLARWTSDLKVGGSRHSFSHRVVSSNKELYSALSLSTHGYQRHNAGGSPAMNQHPNRGGGGSRNIPGYFMLRKQGLALAVWASCGSCVN